MNGAPIFISFASQDIGVAQAICRALESSGFSCWISSRDIGAGGNFQVEIVRAIRVARAMILVFSSHANDSEELKKELAQAGKNKLAVIPVRVENVLPGEAFEYEFGTRQWVDLFRDWGGSIQKLKLSLNELGIIPGAVAQPPVAPRPPPKQWRRAAIIAAPLGIVGIVASLSWWAETVTRKQGQPAALAVSGADANRSRPAENTAAGTKPGVREAAGAPRGAAPVPTATVPPDQVQDLRAPPPLPATLALAQPAQTPSLPTQPPPAAPPVAPSFAVEPANARPLQRDEIIGAQTRLAELGFPMGKIDGVFGQQAQDALRALQIALGVPEDPTLSRDVLEQLQTLPAGMPPVDRRAMALFTLAGRARGNNDFSRALRLLSASERLVTADATQQALHDVKTAMATARPSASVKLSHAAPTGECTKNAIAVSLPDSPGESAAVSRCRGEH
jgi:hypothetical protein